MKTEFLIMVVGLLVIVAIMMGLTPYFSRQNVFYGVTLPVKYQKEEQWNQYRKQFFWLNTLSGLILSLPIWGFSQLSDSGQLSLYSSIYLTIAFFLLLVITASLFLFYRRKLLKFKASLPQEEITEERSEIVVDTNFRKQSLGVPSYLLISSNLLIIGLVVVLTIVNYQQIPSQIVTNWDMNMEPVRWVLKSWQSLAFIPAMQTFILVIFVIANYSFRRARPNLDRQKPEVSVIKNQAFRQASSYMIFYMSLMIQGLFTFIQLGTIFNLMSKVNFPIVVLLFLVLILGGTLYVSLKYGQSGDRYQVKGQKNQGVSTYDNDQDWKLGVFYYNPQDPTIWLEKRTGIGTTMNMARWQSWAFLISILFIPILLAFIFK